jgi:hypothetical protein
MMDKEKNPRQQGGSAPQQQQKPGQTPAPVWEQAEKEKGGQPGGGGQKPSQPGSTGEKSGQQSGGQGGGQTR